LQCSTPQGVNHKLEDNGYEERMESWHVTFDFRSILAAMDLIVKEDEFYQNSAAAKELLIPIPKNKSPQC
jgi:hypothetical protein